MIGSQKWRIFHSQYLGPVENAGIFSRLHCTYYFSTQIVLQRERKGARSFGYIPRMALRREK